MARPSQFLRLLPRFSAFSVAHSAYLNGVRFSSRGSSKTWPRPSHMSGDRTISDNDAEPESEEVEDKLQAVLEMERKRQRSIKYNMIRRKMTPPGAPQRKSTWDAMEQIRYSKQEQPEEWTIERLAEGFSVTPDIISRVSKSKFTPSPNRKAKQDAKVMARLGQQMLPLGSRKQDNQSKSPQSPAPDALTSRRTEDASISVNAQIQSVQIESSGSSVTVWPPKLPAGTFKDVRVTGSTVDEGGVGMKPTVEDEEEEESWDGQSSTEEELEKLSEMDKPPPVVQVGKDFFDPEGNFLYRI